MKKTNIVEANSPFTAQIYRKLSGIIRSSLFVNASYILGTNLLPGLSGFIFWSISTHLYSTHDIGIASAIISITTLVSSISGLGTLYGLIRFLPESIDQTSFLNSIITLNLFTSLLLGLIYFVGIPLWTPGLLVIKNDLLYTSIFFLYLISSTIATIIFYTFVARLHSIYAFSYTIAINTLRLVLLGIFINFNSAGIVGSNAVATFLALLFITFRCLPISIRNYHFTLIWNSDLYKRVIPYSLGNYIVALLAQSPQTFLPLIILEILGPEANGYAYIPLTLIGMITSVGFSLATSAFAEGSNNLLQSHKSLLLAAFLGISISIFIALFIVFGAPWFLWIFGEKFVQQSVSLLRWSSVASIFMVFNQMVFTQLRITKQVWSLIKLSFTLLVMTLTVAYLLMPRIGINAAGIGLLVGNIVISVFVSLRFLVSRNFFIHQKLKTYFPL
jgi:O-antigen/teichoic acid export membrane protein